MLGVSVIVVVVDDEGWEGVMSVMSRSLSIDSWNPAVAADVDA